MLVGHRMGDQKFYYLDFLRTSNGILNRWSRLLLQSLAPITAALGPREGLCPNSGDSNRLMVMMIDTKTLRYKQTCQCTQMYISTNRSVKCILYK
jgi:hypothetical protein